MHDAPIPRRRLSGAADIGWIAAVFFTALVVTTLLLGHLRDGFAQYKIGHRIAYEAGATRQLENERRSLALELQHRSEQIDIWAAAERFGLRPPGEGQIIVVEAPR